MDAAKKSVSPALEEANRRLYELRQQLGARKETAVRSADYQSRPAGDGSKLAADPLAVIPGHLGWGSERLTAVLRKRQRRDGRDSNSQPQQDQQCYVTETSAGNGRSGTNDSGPDSTPERPDWVRLYPDIGLGMLREGQAAPGRLWLMLRFLDQEGRGALRIVNMREQLTKKKSKNRLCGKRQLRNLLRDGEGVYWTRNNGRLWLRSAAKVAFALGVERLSGRPVALPVAAVLEGIGAFKAHLYAAFHSGRVKETPHGTKVMPIARETMTGLSGVGRSSQRAYEERVGIEVQANFAVGDLSTKENQENCAWKQGQALFELKDYRGQQGKKGKTYLAWQLPNTYIGQHRHRPRGRQKRINRELKDLVTKGTPGNVEGTGETQKLEKVYYPNGRLAAKAYGRDPERELYWKRYRTRNGRFDLWQQLGSG